MSDFKPEMFTLSKMNADLSAWLSEKEDQMKQLRELNAELLRLLCVWRNTFGRGGYNSNFLTENDAAIAKAEKFK